MAQRATSTGTATIQALQQSVFASMSLDAKPKPTSAPSAARSESNFMDKILVTHPDNMDAIRSFIQKWFAENYPQESFRWGWPAWLTIQTNKDMDRYAPSEKIRMPDGRIVKREDFVWPTRFVTYGPEDLRWLMWSGVIDEQLEMLFYLIDEPFKMFRVLDDFNFKPTSPRYLINSAGT